MTPQPTPPAPWQDKAGTPEPGTERIPWWEALPARRTHADGWVIEDVDWLLGVNGPDEFVVASNSFSDDTYHVCKPAEDGCVTVRVACGESRETNEETDR